MKNILKVVEKVDRREWDFSTIPVGEERGCCYFEWARESDYIIKELDHPVPDFFIPPKRDEKDKQRLSLENSHIVHALPGRSFTDRYFDSPWQAKPPEWRADFCKRLEKNRNGLNFSRILNKKAYGGFHLGMSQFYNSRLWTENDTRSLDPETELETLLVTINWSNFNDGEIIKDFTDWLKSTEGRPDNIGQRDDRGKNKECTLQANLERLAIMRLSLYYTFDEIVNFLPNSWDNKEKFQSPSEFGRERKAAPETLFELYPFLPRQTRPRSWREL